MADPRFRDTVEVFAQPCGDTSDVGCQISIRLDATVQFMLRECCDPGCGSQLWRVKCITVKTEAWRPKRTWVERSCHKVRHHGSCHWFRVCMVEGLGCRVQGLGLRFSSCCFFIRFSINWVTCAAFFITHPFNHFIVTVFSSCSVFVFSGGPLLLKLRTLNNKVVVSENKGNPI